MKKIDINVDIGEGFAFDEDLLDFATSANVCCGEYAGSWELTKDTIFLCRRKGVRIGMHPGFPDRHTMGRERMKEDEVAQFANSILEQAVQFVEYAEDTAYVKPHGAWYNMLTEHVPADPSLAMACRLMLQGVLAVARVPAMLLRGSPIVAEVEKSGDSMILEGFADRAYTADGTLRSRSLPGALLQDPADIKAQVLWLAPLVDSICIHGDTEGCVEIAALVYETIENNGFEVGF
jgi:5-oxoprolinase (ATP-hydrolysing) subunit A